MTSTATADWQKLLDRLKPENHPTRSTFQQIAAMLGPGWQGKKIPESQKAEVTTSLLDQWDNEKHGEPPAYLSKETNWVDRKAKLFEIGSYQDKNLNVTEFDLQKLQSNFNEPVQILIEHTENPLQLGYLTQVEAIGKELFGILSLTKEADDLIESSKAKSLSISVSRDLDSIFEVSIVSNPRVESAQLFCSDFTNLQPFENQIRFSIEGYLSSGKILPAQKQAVEQLVNHAEKAGMLEPLIRFFDSLPNRIFGVELAPAGASPSPFSHEETQFYQEHFPELPLNEIHQRRNK